MLNAICFLRMRKPNEKEQQAFDKLIYRGA